MLYGDGGPRFGLHKDYPHTLYVRPAVEMRVSDFLTFNGGGAWFFTFNDDYQVNELQLWQGVRFEWTVSGRVLLNSWNRLEERWFFSEGERLFRARFRSLFGVTVPLNHATMRENTLYVPLAFEVFEDINDTHPFFINRARLYLGAGYVVDNRTRVELFYIANETRASRDDKFGIADVVRVRVHYTL